VGINISAMRNSKITKYLLLIILWTTGCKQTKPDFEPNIDAWYKHLVVYNLDVKTFKDSNGDGEGDFNGLTEKLSYLKALGINTIWLAPFQPSPLKDDGYDVSDYFGIDPKIGTEADFKAFMARAKAMNIYVIMDLVLNHTSNESQWFKSASQDSLSPTRNWYLWSKARPKDWDKGMGFPEVEKETWRYDSVAKQYFFHRFYNFQPDLNYQNPAVIRKAESVLAYWLDQGMDGFRLDAVPFIIDNPRESAEQPKFDFPVLHRLALFAKSYKKRVVLLGEANVEPEENKKYFSSKDGLDIMFNFYANQYLFYGLASGDAGLLKKALEKTRTKPGLAQWAWFLRNHDEVDLGRLSKHEINTVYKKMGPDTNMQLYKRGIRRRLAPMLGNDPATLRMAYSLLYALPGTAVIRQGEEIGMGDDLRLKERLSVRTPMQWDSSANGGFSSARVTFRPVINLAPYGYKTINVALEQRDPRSLLNFIKELIALRKQCPEINNGEWQVADSGTDKVLVITYNDHGKRLLVAHNFSDKPVKTSVDIPGNAQKLTNLFAEQAGAVIKDGMVRLEMPGHGFQWLRLN
jgi:maltose alpha-D-glucosyltransferase/alpha-amylase